MYKQGTYNKKPGWIFLFGLVYIYLWFFT
jgi:hypothetical protein